MNIRKFIRVLLSVFTLLLILVSVAVVRCQKNVLVENEETLANVQRYAKQIENRQRLQFFASEIRKLFDEDKQFGGRLFFQNKEDENNLSEASQGLLLELHSIFGSDLIEIEVERLKESKPVWIKGVRLGFIVALEEGFFLAEKLDNIIWYDGKVGVFDYR